MHTRDAQFDVLSAIIVFWDKMVATPFPVHVLGHQDDHAQQDSLPRLARLNIAMDLLAKYILKQSLLLHQQAPLTSFSFGLPPVSCHTVPIESALVKSSVNTIATMNAREYWTDKFNISLPLSLTLNWSSFGRAFKAIGFSRQIFIRKWLSKTVPVGATLRKRKNGTDNRCSRCIFYDETTQHVLTCTDREAKSHRTALLNALFASIHEMDTCPLLATAIEDVLTRWLRRPQGFQLAACHFDSSLEYCMNSQDNLGWYHFLCGFHSIAIVHHQQAFFLHKRCQKSAPYWASKLTRALWTFIHECGRIILYPNTPLTSLDQMPLKFVPSVRPLY